MSKHISLIRSVKNITFVYRTPLTVKWTPTKLLEWSFLFLKARLHRRFLSPNSMQLLSR